MSFGLIQGSNAPGRLNTGTFVLPISAIVQSNGLTQVGNRFTVTDLGPYVVGITMRVAANTDNARFTLQIFNFTAGVVAASEAGEAPSSSEGEDYMFMLPLTVVSSTDEYEFRLVIENCDTPKAFFILAPQFSALMQSTFGGAGSPQYVGGQLDSGGGNTNWTFGATGVAQRGLRTGFSRARI